MSVLGPDAEQAEVDVAAGGFMTPEGDPPPCPPPLPALLQPLLDPAAVAVLALTLVACVWVGEGLCVCRVCVCLYKGGPFGVGACVQQQPLSSRLTRKGFTPPRHPRKERSSFLRQHVWAASMCAGTHDVFWLTGSQA